MEGQDHSILFDLTIATSWSPSNMGSSRCGAENDQRGASRSLHPASIQKTHLKRMTQKMRLHSDTVANQ